MYLFFDKVREPFLEDMQSDVAAQPVIDRVTQDRPEDICCDQEINVQDPLAAAAPDTNNRESPGRKGVMTKPVSKKMMQNRKKYVQIP